MLPRERATLVGPPNRCRRMHTAPRARPALLRALSFRAAAALVAAGALAACGAAGSAPEAPLDVQRPPSLGISPAFPDLTVGESLDFAADGSGLPVRWRSLDETILSIDSAGHALALAQGSALVVASAGMDADTIEVRVRREVFFRGGREWAVVDDGATVRVENDVLRLRFAYDAAGREGWFTGGESSGGGGRDGGIVELYYKPTSPTRNLVFRNGQWGSLYDQMDLFEVEEVAADRLDHDSPDLGSGRDARMLSHRVSESAGRLIAEFEFDLAAWRILRTYTVYPWGDITVRARVTQVATGRYNYLAHRFVFAASRARFHNAATGRSYDWGSNFQLDREVMHAWSDGEPTREYVEPIRDAVDRNTVLHEEGRRDAYSGFMLDDRNGNDPDIVVMNGDRSIAESPFHQISSRFGGTQYVETALFSPRWAPDNLTHADMTWFYLGTPCCEVRWSDPPLWGTELGSWEESFHVFLRRGLRPADYLPLWRSRAAAPEAEAPGAVRNGTTWLDRADRLHHITADPDATELSWEWLRSTRSEGEVDFRTAFVVHGFPATAAEISGADAPGLMVYGGGGDGDLLVVLTGEQPAEPVPYRITLRR